VPVTSVHQLPYPSEDDIPNVPGDMQRLAEAVDTALGPADTWQPLTLDDGWTGSAFVKKYPDGTVALAGLIGSPITDPTNKGTFATLPEQYRPAVIQRLSMNSQCTTDRFTGNYLARLVVNTSGVMTVMNLGPRATSAPFYLDGIRYALDVPAYQTRMDDPPDYGD
jgi:hypothetical protein